MSAADTNRSSLLSPSNSAADDYRRSSCVRLASHVHRAIRNGDYDWLPQIVHHDNQVLWEPNGTTGWTAVHFALSHPLPTFWLEWILVRAASADAEQAGMLRGVTSATACPASTDAIPPEELSFRVPDPATASGMPTQSLFLTKLTNLGESPWEIFFKSYLNPFPWQLCENESQLLKEASQECLLSSSNSSTRMLRLVRHCLENQAPIQNMDQYEAPEDRHDGSRQSSVLDIDEQSSRSTAVERVARFLGNLVLLGRATMGKLRSPSSLPEIQPLSTGIGVEMSHCKSILHGDDIAWLSLLACTGCCPDIVTRLVWCFLRLEQHENSMLRPPTEPLALHVWACSKTTRCDSCDDGTDMLPLLLEAYPAAPLEPYQGWLPLHLALTRGKTWEQVQRLIRAAPLQVLTTSTTVPYALPLVALVAAFGTQACTPIMRARQRVTGKNGVGIAKWNFFDGHRQLKEIEEAEQELDCVHFSTMYCILRAYPQALQDAR